MEQENLRGKFDSPPDISFGTAQYERYYRKELNAIVYISLRRSTPDQRVTETNFKSNDCLGGSKNSGWLIRKDQNT